MEALRVVEFRRPRTFSEICGIAQHAGSLTAVEMGKSRRIGLVSMLCLLDQRELSGKPGTKNRRRIGQRKDLEMSVKFVDEETSAMDYGRIVIHGAYALSEYGGFVRGDNVSVEYPWVNLALPGEVYGTNELRMTEVEIVIFRMCMSGVESVWGDDDLDF